MTRLTNDRTWVLQKCQRIGKTIEYYQLRLVLIALNKRQPLELQSLSEKKFQRSIYGCYMKMLVLITIDFLWPGRSVDLGKAGERVCLQRAKSFWRRQ